MVFIIDQLHFSLQALNLLLFRLNLSLQLRNLLIFGVLCDFELLL